MNQANSSVFEEHENEIKKIGKIALQSYLNTQHDSNHHQFSQEFVQVIIPLIIQYFPQWMKEFCTLNFFILNPHVIAAIYHCSLDLCIQYFLKHHNEQSQLLTDNVVQQQVLILAFMTVVDLFQLEHLVYAKSADKQCFRDYFSNKLLNSIFQDSSEKYEEMHSKMEELAGLTPCAQTVRLLLQQYKKQNSNSNFNPFFVNYEQRDPNRQSDTTQNNAVQYEFEADENDTNSLLEEHQGLQLESEDNKEEPQDDEDNIEVENVPEEDENEKDTNIEQQHLENQEENDDTTDEEQSEEDEQHQEQDNLDTDKNWDYSNNLDEILLTFLDNFTVLNDTICSQNTNDLQDLLNSITSQMEIDDVDENSFGKLLEEFVTRLLKEGHSQVAAILVYSLQLFFLIYDESKTEGQCVTLLMSILLWMEQQFQVFETLCSSEIQSKLPEILAEFHKDHLSKQVIEQATNQLQEKLQNAEILPFSEIQQNPLDFIKPLQNTILQIKNR